MLGVVAILLFVSPGEIKLSSAAKNRKRIHLKTGGSRISENNLEIPRDTLYRDRVMSRDPLYHQDRRSTPASTTDIDRSFRVRENRLTERRSAFEASLLRRGRNNEISSDQTGDDSSNRSKKKISFSRRRNHVKERLFGLSEYGDVIGTQTGLLRASEDVIEISHGLLLSNVNVTYMTPDRLSPSYDAGEPAGWLWSVQGHSRRKKQLICNEAMCDDVANAGNPRNVHGKVYF